MRVVLSLAFLIGLHIPKGFAVLYLLLLILLLSSRKSSPLAPCLRWSIGCLSVFSISYVWMSFCHSFWTLRGNGIFDAISMLFLPALCVWVGAKAGCKFDLRCLAMVVVAYAFGAAIFAVSTLLFNRILIQGNGLGGLFLPSQEPVYAIFSPGKLVNVRSIEQNASFVAAMLPLALAFLIRCKSLSMRLSFSLISLLCLAGLVSGFVFDGRLVFVSSLVSWFFILVVWISRSARVNAFLFRKYGPVILASLSFLICVLGTFFRPPLAFFHDERLDRYMGFLSIFWEYPYGGNLMRFKWVNSLSGQSHWFDPSGNGTDVTTLMHNVVMDVHLRVGLFPALMLVFGMIPLLACSVRGLLGELPASTGAMEVLIVGCFIICLMVQWIFQPLQYSDGLLFYVGFLVLGFVSTRSSRYP